MTVGASEPRPLAGSREWISPVPYQPQKLNRKESSGVGEVEAGRRALPQRDEAGLKGPGEVGWPQSSHAVTWSQWYHSKQPS